MLKEIKMGIRMCIEMEIGMALEMRMGKEIEVYPKALQLTN